MRPVLKSALRPLWRDRDTLQLGLDPRHAVLLEHVDAACMTVLSLLDGVRETDSVVADAAAKGVPREATEAMLTLLASSGALDDAGVGHVDDRRRPDAAHLSLVTSAAGSTADVLRRRAAATVLVVGAGRVGASVAALLAAAGVGRLRLRDPAPGGPADASPAGGVGGARGRARVFAAAAVAAAAGAEVDAEAVPADATACAGATLAVVAAEPYLAPAPGLAATLAGAGVPHLVAGVRETSGIVGPLVHPGRTSCARCHDHARAERDPRWPVMAAQLAAQRSTLWQACDVTLATATAAVAAGQALTQLGGPPPVLCVDATLELRLPEWTLRRRSWAPHPACPCGAAGLDRSA